MNRMKTRTVAKVLCCYLAVALLAIGIAEKSYAGFSPSEVMALSPFERTVDLEKIQTVLETRVVSEKLAELGFTKEEIQTKLDQLSDQQLHQVALRVDELKVGGDAGGFIIGVLVIAVLVVLFFYLLRRA